MNINEYLERLQLIHINILKFIDMEANIEENYQNVINIFEEQKIRENIHETKLILRMLSTIANNHCHSTNFYSKIEKLIFYFKNEIIKEFKKNEICKIFDFNKRIVLFLIKEQIAIMDEPLANELIELNYQRYFYPEMNALRDELKNHINNNSDQKVFNINDDNYKCDDNKSDIESSDVFDSQEESYDENDDKTSSGNDKQEISSDQKNKKRKWWYRKTKPAITDDDLFSDFEYDYVPEETKEFNIDEDKRMIGENDNEICEIIRKDLIEEFIIYVNKNDIPLNMKVKKSIYETDLFLCKSSISLISYAAYFGSVQIFKYLYLNGVILTSNEWLLAIHSDNEELIHIFEEQNIEKGYKENMGFYEYAIQCHYNDVARYVEENYLNDEIKEKDKYYKHQWIEFYNFSLFQNDFSNIPFILGFLVEYDYYTLVELFLKEKKNRYK